MATNQPTNVTTDLLAEFDSVGTQINQVFNPLIEQLIARRDALLLTLSEIQEDYICKETTRKASIDEIRKVQEHLNRLSLKVNIMIPIHEQARETYKQGLIQLNKSVKTPSLYFQCPTLHKLRSLIADFGEMVEWEVPDYTLKIEPVLLAGKLAIGPKEFNARGLAIDESNERMYIADCGNKRIQIFSFEGNLLKKIGQDKLKQPHGIAINNEHIFVTDTELHALFQFHKSSFQLVSRTGAKGEKEGQFNDPRGLCVDSSGDVFIADYNNHRVCIFSKYLQFMSCLGIEQLKYPRDVKQTNDCVLAVLDASSQCVHFFSRDGHLLSSCVSRGLGSDNLVYSPSFLCLDTACNVIVSDFDKHSIKIITRTGQLMHTIGKRGKGKGELNYPSGISVSHSGTIFFVSGSNNCSIWRL